MTTSAEAVAEAIRAAGSDRTKSRKLLASLYAESIELHHVPPGPNDGPVASSVLVAIAEQEVAAVERALPNPTIHTPDVTVDGDRVRVRNRIEGDVTTGKHIDVTTNTVFTVAAGRIVGLQSEMDPDAMQTWVEVLTIGAFELPTTG
jgi:hypothetical protein